MAELEKEKEKTNRAWERNTAQKIRDCFSSQNTNGTFVLNTNGTFVLYL